MKVPVLIGANTDEGTSFGPRGINTESDFIYAGSQRRLPQSFLEAVLKAYPDTPDYWIPKASIQIPESWGKIYRRAAA